jgi:hypothetical protein
MLEFLFSRLTMSLCAIMVLFALAPLACSSFISDHGNSPEDALKQLASRFDEVAYSSGEVRLELHVSDYLREGIDYFLLRGQSLWLEGEETCLDCHLPYPFRIYLDSGGSEVELEEARLSRGSTLTLWRNLAGVGAVLEAHIENFDAISDTLSPNISASSKSLYT